MDNNKVDISSIERARQLSGLTKKRLCEYAGITTPTYASWILKGTTLYNVERLRRAISEFIDDNNLSQAGDYAGLALIIQKQTIK